MPVYEYECGDCGMFDQLRPMSEAGLDGVCPTCGRDAPRVMSAPQIRLVNPMARMARERNEKSRHAPHVCTGSCHHRHAASNSTPGNDPAKPKRQMYTGARPWVIEHR